MNKLTTYIARKAKVTTGACCFLACLATLATSCTSDMLGGDGADTLSGDGKKTPLTVSAGLSNTAEITRAGGDEGFAQNANLLVYLRHTTGARGIDDAYPVTTADQAPRLVSLTCNNGGTPETDFTISYTNTGGGTTTQLYWDDFSNSASETTDLRTDGHGLQSYYGYCYNGGEGDDNAEGKTVQENISAALIEASGVLGWSVPQIQSSQDMLTKADLLWSAEQDAVIYAHADKNVGGDHHTVNIPFSHAMSKITINVIAGENYETGCLGSTQVQIADFNTVGTFTAPSQTIEATAHDNVTLFGETETKNSDEKPMRTFTAMTVPHTNLSLGNTLAIIKNVVDNDYTVPVTQGIIDAWSGQLVESTEELNNGFAQAKGTRADGPEPGTGWITKPGVNYVLNVTISKTKITLSASLKDWDYVEANAEGLIAFEGDVTEKGEIATALQADGFDVYKNTVNTSFPDKSTTLTYAASKWNYTPAIYWQNKNDKEFFRAISPAGTDLGNLQQGTDYLWGTSANSNPEVAVNPRTGDVPLDFEHAMSMITVQLETSTGAAAALNLAGATISISNLSTTGSINLVDGAITPSAQNAEAITLMAAPIEGYSVIPQDIANDAIVTIELADHTRYTLQLNTCKVDTGTKDDEGNPIYKLVTKWVRGNHYIYTIHLDKEQITFRAMIKNWVNTYGGGNATLEWD